MKLTKSKLKQLIKEEIQNILEAHPSPDPHKHTKKTDLGPGPYVNACGKKLTGKGWINYKKSGANYWIFQQHGNVKCGECWTPCADSKCKGASKCS